jgi:dipeptidyl aminopeptidase/acylaminoacyl peptidase
MFRSRLCLPACLTLAALLWASLTPAPLAAQTLKTIQPFTLQQVLSAPYATGLTAAPLGDQFAWVEDAQGKHNLWAAVPHAIPRQLTHFDDDDGLDITNVTWSPDATTIVFTHSSTLGPDDKPANPAHLQHVVAPTLWLQPTDGRPGSPLAEGHSPLFARDGHTLLFIRNDTIWSLSLSDSQHQAAQLIFDRGRASELTLSPDGNLLAFISTRGHGEREHSFLALFDLRSHTLTFPAPSTGNDSAPAFSPDGKHIAWLRSPFVTAPEFAPNRVSPNPWSIQLLDLATGDARAVFSPDADQYGSVLPHMSVGEPRLYWTAPAVLAAAPGTTLSNHEGQSPRPAPPAVPYLVFASEADGWVHLYAINPSDPSDPKPFAHPLTPGNFEVEDISLSNDRGTLFFASNQVVKDPFDVDRRHLWKLDLKHIGDAPTEITRGAGIETHPVLSADGRDLVALTSDPFAPMLPALIDPKTGVVALHPDAIPLTYPTTQLVIPQQVVFPSSDNQLTLHGQLFVPHNFDANVRHAAIIFFHGGPHRQMLLGYPAMDYYSNAYAMNQYLASRGFVVLSVNYRCGIGYGLDFRQCVHAGADGASEYNDVLGAVQYLRSGIDVDPKRVGVWGGSYGGYLTALALARDSDLFAAGVDFHGVHQWILEDNATADWLRGSLADQQRIAAVAYGSSPLYDVDRWRSPVLLIHGDDDPDVAYAQTPTLADALRARHVPVEELIFPDEVHDFILHKDWLTSYEAAADFFIRTLHPDQTAQSVH